MSEDKLNTYSTELRWTFKDHSSNRESLAITVFENQFELTGYPGNTDEILHMALTPKSARVLAEMLLSSADFVEKIKWQSWGQHLPSEDAIMNRFEKYPHLKNKPVT